MAILELTLVPIGTGVTSVSKYVAKAYEAVKDNKKIKVDLNPMGTVLEGDIEDLFSAVRDMQEKVFSTGVDRLYSVIKVDDRRDKDSHMADKVSSVMEKVEG